MKNKYLYIYILLLALVIILFFGELLFTGSSLFLQDIINQFQPFRAFAAESIQKGEIPLWNPYIYSGMPFLANLQSAVFYPLTVLFYLFPFAFALKVFTVLHFFLAGLFAYLLLSQMGTGRAGSFLGASVFMLNGYFVSRVHYLSITGSVAWLPVEILLLRGLLAEKDDRRASLVSVSLALSFAMQFFAGHTQIFVYSIGFCAAYAAWHIYLEKETGTDSPGLKKLSGRLSAVLLISAGIMMAQFLPSLEFMKNSIRWGGLGYGLATKWSLEITDLKNFFIPLFSGGVGNTGYFWQKNIFTGIVPVLLALLSFFSVDRKRQIFPAIVFLFAVVIALGSNTPVYGMLYGKVTLFGMFRYPSSIMYIAVFAVSLMAAAGADFLVRKNRVLPALILIALTLLNLFSAGRPCLKFLDNKIFSEKGVNARILQKNTRFERFLLSPRTEYYKSAGGPTLYAAWKEMKDLMFGDINMPFHLYNAGGQDVRVKWYDEFLENIESAESAYAVKNLLDVAGVKYVLSGKEIGGTGFSRVKKAGVSVYKNSGFLPRVWCVSSVKTLDEKGVLDYMAGALYEPGKEAVFAGNFQGRPYSANTGKCGIDSYSANALSISADTAGPCWLIVADTFYPGWKAFLNGKRVPVYRVNHAFRSVNLNGGKEELHMVYRPLSFTAGVIISTLACLLAIFNLVLKK